MRIWMAVALTKLISLGKQQASGDLLRELAEDFDKQKILINDPVWCNLDIL